MTRLAALFAALWLVVATAAADPQTLADMRADHPISLKARVGERVAAREARGSYFFTLRDDFGNMALGETHQDIGDLHFGATYILHGVPRIDPATKKLELEVDGWQPAYEKSLAPYLIIGALAVLGLGGGLWWVARRARAAGPKPPWDYAEVLSGPNAGLLVPLREDRILLGRKVDPQTEICLSGDDFVSREHGVLTRRDGIMYYRDTESKCGSFLNEQRVSSGEEVRVPPGSLLRLGPHTIIRLGTAPNLGDAAQTRRIEELVDGESFGTTG